MDLKQEAIELERNEVDKGKEVISQMSHCLLVINKTMAVILTQHN